MFANGPWDQGSIPGQVIPKTQKMVLDTSLLRYVSRVKWSYQGKGVAATKREPLGCAWLQSPTSIWLVYTVQVKSVRVCPGVMAKALDCGSEWVWTPVALLHSLLDKYPWERYEAPYSPSYGLNSTTTVLLKGCGLALNNLQRLICH